MPPGRGGSGRGGASNGGRGGKRSNPLLQHSNQTKIERIISRKGTHHKTIASKSNDSDEDLDSDDNMMRFEKSKPKGDVSDDDEEVFNLAVNASDDDDDDDDDDEDSNDDDGEDDEEYKINNENQNSSEENYSDESEYDSNDEEGNYLKDIIDNLPAHLKHKVKGTNISDSEDEDEKGEEEEEGWGKKKMYWSGDTADLEIGQDIQDANDEEDEAKNIQRQKMSKMKEIDFYDDFGDNVVVENEDDNMFNDKKENNKKDKLFGQLEYLALGTNNKSGVNTEKISRDITKLTKKQRLGLITAESPELLGLVDEVKYHMKILQDLLSPLRQFLLKNNFIPTPVNILDYLETKEQLLLLHCTNVAFYLYMKAQGKSLNGHPVMNQLLEIKYSMEKMRKLDIQLEDALNALFTLTEMDLDQVKEISSKENFVKCIMIGKLEDDDDDEEEEEEDDDVDENGFSYSKEVENNDDDEEEEEEEEDDDENEEDDEDDEKDIQFDLDQDDKMFNKSSNSSKDLKKNKKSSKLNANIDDIGEFEEKYKKDNRGEKMSMETFLSNIESKKNDKKGSKYVDNDDSGDDFGGNFDDDEGYDDDDIFGYHPPAKKNDRKRQKAPSSLDDDVDEEDDLLEAFTKKKKEFKALKLDHYVPAPRIGGVQEILPSGKKRAASYEIIKNRGLTPHRKKANRNGRVKKKEMYAKAIIARKGQVREVIKGVGSSYGGELTGVKANISRSRKITN